MIHQATRLVISMLLATPVAIAAAEEGPSPAAPAPSALPWYLADRGTGVPTSLFGTYIRRGELIIYPFFEYYRDDDFEYKPSELGYPGEVDYRGRYRANEGLLFLGYGISENVAVELEMAVIDASLEKSPQDVSAVPERIEESGLGDVEGQLRWRIARETPTRPEVFSYFETVLPHSSDKVLIGTPGWELKLGGGVIRGFRWGTLTARLAVAYDEASSTPFEFGEYALEYLKRLSPRFRVYVGIEGNEDELELITELQWHLGTKAFVKLNSGFGLTSKAVDWAPEIGIVFTLPTRRASR